MSISSADNGSQYMDANQYKAARDGNFEVFNNYPQSLDHLITGKNKNTILHLHVDSPCKRKADFVEKVLDRCPTLLWQTNNDGDVPLHIAAKNGHREIVKLLINEAKKAVHRDLETGEEEAVRRLLRLRNKQHESALHLASTGRPSLFDSLVKEILEHEDPNNYSYTPNKSGESPLYLATKERCIGSAFEILKKFESPDCRGPNGKTVFHLFTTRHRYDDDCLDLLFRKLASFVNQADEKGWTPLHHAAYEGRLKVVQKILDTDKSSAYATEKSRNRTPLHMAACRGNVDEMKEIIEKCPESCEITDFRGWNVLHYAVTSSSEKSVKLIMEDSSLAYLVNGKDIKGCTPLQLLIVNYGYISPLFSWLESDKCVLPSALVDELYVSNILNSGSIMKREDTQEWMKDLGEDPSGKRIVVSVRMKSREEIENETAEKVIPNLEKAKDSHLVAAALVATVTFAAAFTLPGGYISDENDSKLQGTPILSRNAAFKAFVVTDAIAMVLSTSSVLIHFVMVLLGYKLRYYWLIRSAFWFIVLAMGAMVVAFVTGTYAVLAPNSMELAIATCVIGLTFFVHVFYASIRLVFNFIKRDQVDNKDSTITESLERLTGSAPQYLCFGCDWWYDWQYW